MEASKSCKSKLMSFTPSNHDGEDGFGYFSDAEYYDNIDNGLGDDWDPSQPLEPLIPIVYSTAFDSLTSNSCSRTIMDEDIESDIEETEKNDAGTLNEVFFNAVIDRELQGEITIISWIQALKELNMNMTEKQMYQIFNFMDEEHQGYIDSVDFVSFCAKASFENATGVEKLQSELNAAIKKHPFMISLVYIVTNMHIPDTSVIDATRLIANNNRE